MYLRVSLAALLISDTLISQQNSVNRKKIGLLSRINDANLPHARPIVNNLERETSSSLRGSVYKTAELPDMMIQLSRRMLRGRGSNQKRQLVNLFFRPLILLYGAFTFVWLRIEILFFIFGIFWLRGSAWHAVPPASFFKFKHFCVSHIDQKKASAFGS